MIVTIIVVSIVAVSSFAIGFQQGHYMGASSTYRRIENLYEQDDANG